MPPHLGVGCMVPPPQRLSPIKHGSPEPFSSPWHRVGEGEILFHSHEAVKWSGSWESCARHEEALVVGAPCTPTFSCGAGTWHAYACIPQSREYLPALLWEGLLNFLPKQGIKHPDWLSSGRVLVYTRLHLETHGISIVFPGPCWLSSPFFR